MSIDYRKRCVVPVVAVTSSGTIEATMLVYGATAAEYLAQLDPELRDACHVVDERRRYRFGRGRLPGDAVDAPKKFFFTPLQRETFNVDRRDKKLLDRAVSDDARRDAGVDTGRHDRQDTNADEDERVEADAGNEEGDQGAGE